MLKGVHCHRVKTLRTTWRHMLMGLENYSKLHKILILVALILTLDVCIQSQILNKIPEYNF